MDLKRLLGPLFLAFCIAQCQGQTCTSITDVTMNGEEFLVDVSGTPCLRCLNSEGVSEPATQWTLGGLIFPGNPSLTGLERRSDGALVFLDPGLYIVGGDTQLSCLNSERQLRLSVSSNALLPPILGSQSLTILEDTTGSVNCFDPNSVLLGVQQVWIDTMGGKTFFSILNLVNITRAEAGEYVCNLTSNDGQSIAVVLTVTVQYGPEATTQEVISRNISLGESMMLRCDFDGVPTPSVVWLQNGTEELNSTLDSRVSINTRDGVSMLNIDNLDRFGGGQYTCSFSSSVGDLERNVTTVLILIPPAPVTNLDTPTVEQRTVVVTWTKGFDGFTPIMGAVIVYTPPEGGGDTIQVNSSDPTTVTLEDLIPFTEYNISVTLFNMVGGGDSRFIQATTDSLLLVAPVSVMITVVSSTQLGVSWEAPPVLRTTAPPTNWLVEISEMDGSNPDSDPIGDPATRTAMFPSLSKGTLYRVRVRGTNQQGDGPFSDYIMRETAIDAPSLPLNVVVVGVTSFALRATWSAPSDNGGRELMDYNVSVSVTGIPDQIVPFPETTALIRSDVFFMEDMPYDVSVSARNTEMLTGLAVTITGTTLALDQPQAIIDDLVRVEVMNTSFEVSWEDPGGDVDLYLITYTRRLGNVSFNQTVDSNVTSFTLTGLEPATSYDIVVFSMNSNGFSIASPLLSFQTDAPTPPVIVGSEDGTVLEGETVVLTCTTTDTPMITWRELSGIPLVAPVFEAVGGFNTSTLTISDIRLAHAGDYECRVREETDTFTLSVTEVATTPIPTTAATEITRGGISNTIIIVVASIGGAIPFAVLLLAAIFICCCCCCRSKKEGGKYVTNKALKPDKRTKELFEVSTSYAPVREQPGEEVGISFNMPEDYQAHSSFNTLDKVNKLPKRSSSPDPAPYTSSFGVSDRTSTDNLTSGANRGSSPPQYQDMSPPSYQDMPGATGGGTDGTLL